MFLMIKTTFGVTSVVGLIVTGLSSGREYNALLDRLFRLVISRCQLSKNISR